METVALDARQEDRRETALAQALFVTFLWSTSFVLIKIGLHDLAIAPLSFAGLRYTIAALLLLPFAVRGIRRARPDRRAWTRVLTLGLLFYAATQGAQYVALDTLPSAAVSLVLTATPVAVFAWSAVRRVERGGPLQAAGIFVVLVGAALYFLPLSLPAGAGLALAVAVLGMLANAASALLGRHIARDAVERLGGIVPMTALSMLLGGVVMLASGVATSGAPKLDSAGWTIVLWLAVVNTAFAFTLWNHTLRTLTAIESNVMNNTMLIQIALLAWIFLGESLNGRQLLGIALAVGGIGIVQLGPLLINGSRAWREARGGR